MRYTRISVMLYPTEFQALEAYRHANGITTLSRAARDLIALAPSDLVLEATPRAVAGSSVSVSCSPATLQQLDRLKQATGGSRSAVMRAVIRASAAVLGQPTSIEVGA